MFSQRFEARRYGRSLFLMCRVRSVPLVFFCYALAFACVSACVKLPRQGAGGVVRSLTTSEAAHAAPTPTATTRININTASRAELERLSGIGTGLAARIIEHRERHGAFRRVEHLIIVRGISQRRFESLRPFVTN
ncbi:MAG TPA: helix-hairpin-helix domain-containing protein [Pyrinomonadaceae bacterium]|nr:helix-hairpin-helix domain-containing protein [Pyrinomonadaceae bacterium]